MTCIYARKRDVLATIGNAGSVQFGVHFSHTRADGNARISPGRSPFANRKDRPYCSTHIRKWILLRKRMRAGLEPGQTRSQGKNEEGRETRRYINGQTRYGSTMRHEGIFNFCGHFLTMESPPDLYTPVAILLGARRRDNHIAFASCARTLTRIRGQRSEYAVIYNFFHE